MIAGTCWRSVRRSKSRIRRPANSVRSSSAQDAPSRRDSGWLNTAFIDLRREDFKVGDQDEVSTLLVPGMSWWRGTDTSSARPANAYRLAFDVRGTSTALGSDTSFVQVEARARYIKTLNRTHALAYAS